MEQENIQAQSPSTRMVLRTEGLVKKYGKRTVVNDVSFDVKQGEIVGLLGPNGAGKTTSFYMTTGLVVPNGGRIFLDEKDITDAPVYKRAKQGIGYLDDGTMVVVEEGRKYIGKRTEVSVYSILQTSSGRMIFAKVK